MSARVKAPPPKAAELPPPIAVELRRDGDRIPVLWAGTPVVGQPWTLLVGVCGDGVSTVRQTTIVRHVIADPIQ